MDAAIGNTGFGFSGSGEILRLYDQVGVIVDFVNYSDLPPWPLEPDGYGPTLELIDAAMDNALPESWAASVGHGTPGAINSASDPSATPGDAPAAFGLRAPYPNPFNPAVNIPYALDRDARVLLSVHDIDGRLIAVLADGFEKAGGHEILWNGRNSEDREQASGVYMLRLRSGERRAARKILLLK